MKINGAEVGFFYSIRAKCEIDKKFIEAGVNDFKSYIAKYGDCNLTIMLAVALNRAYAKANGVEPLTEDSFLDLSAEELSVLDSEVFDAITKGQKISVEAKPEKNAKSTSK